MVEKTMDSQEDLFILGLRFTEDLRIHGTMEILE